MDDMGEGFSNLRMWSEVWPEFVKIDRHFAAGIGDFAPCTKSPMPAAAR
jgi:EAL domain-containing protein (putative c-di-GMP-specific phosphodiesterase class I)